MEAYNLKKIKEFFKLFATIGVSSTLITLLFFTSKKILRKKQVLGITNFYN